MIPSPIRTLTAITVGLFLAAAACSSDDPADSDSDRADQAKGVEGIYKLQSDQFGGTLEVLSASADRIEFNLTVVIKGGGNNFGDLQNAEALPTDGGQLIFSPDSDCTIAFTKVSAEAIDLAQVGSCGDAGFGAFVDASGTYRRDNSHRLVGTYKLDSTSFGGTLGVLAASLNRIEFNLTVVARGGGNNFGDLQNAEALPTDGGQLIFSPDSDCTIAFAAVSVDSIELTQVGSCAEAGFGAFVEASGAYRAAGPECTDGSGNAGDCCVNNESGSAGVCLDTDANTCSVKPSSGDCPTGSGAVRCCTVL